MMPVTRIIIIIIIIIIIGYRLSRTSLTRRDHDGHGGDRDGRRRPVLPGRSGVPEIRISSSCDHIGFECRPIDEQPTECGITVRTDGAAAADPTRIAGNRGKNV
jgi:hypothetical protein